MQLLKPQFLTLSGFKFSRAHYTKTCIESAKAQGLKRIESDEGYMLSSGQEVFALPGGGFATLLDISDKFTGVLK